MTYFGADIFGESSQVDDRHVRGTRGNGLASGNDHPYRNIITKLILKRLLVRRKVFHLKYQVELSNQISKAAPDGIFCAFNFIVFVSSCKYRFSSTFIAPSRLSFDCIVLSDGVLPYNVGTAQTFWKIIGIRPLKLIAST